ncbi:hypothetical protein ABZ345_44445 [Lentzea sp. NPDC005914]|uniref:hypothetical protein n=1 Tax=Lentzea sp. NPDC005914 TaxID=3154572 RepID=UPI0033E63DF3
MVAFAMFHRGAQWVTASDLDDDLEALLGATQPKPYGMRKPLSEADRIVGRFFSVQCAKAIREEETLRTYEFLHATFGEYLVARFTWRILNDLHASEASRYHRVSGAQPDDSHLHALLSLTPLTSSNSVIDFLIELAGTSDERDSLLKLTSAILALAQHGRPRTTEAYQPVVRTVPARHAIYSLNLVIVAAILGRGAQSKELGIPDWSTQATFWKAQLSPSDWRTLFSSVNVRWSNESSVSITIGSMLPDKVEFTSLHSRVTLREAALDAHFTGDASINKFKYAFEALPEGRFDVEYARALIELFASPVAPTVRATRYLHWASLFPDLVLDALRRDITVDAATLAKLADTEMGASSAFVIQILDRVGRGGDDNELLTIFRSLAGRRLRGTNYGLALFDAWLRLYESGFMPGQAITEIVNLASAVDLVQIEAARPDLIKRLDLVLTEAGITGDNPDATAT